MWQGHGQRVWDYTLRQVNLFAEKANARLEKTYGCGDRDGIF